MDLGGDCLGDRSACSAGIFSTAVYRAFSNQPGKGLLYFILFAAAVYWGFEDDFLDFWDAVLWLFAFFVIERNVVSWRQEADVDRALND